MAAGIRSAGVQPFDFDPESDPDREAPAGAQTLWIQQDISERLFIPLYLILCPTTTTTTTPTLLPLNNNPPALSIHLPKQKKPLLDSHCLGFSIVHQYIQRFNEVSGNKSAVIRRRTKTGVMITQNVANMPEGKSTPDFQCKPIPVTVKEGKLAVFKAVVKGDPKPEVSWRRAKGTISDKDKFKSKYDESTGEHILEIHKVSAAEADTYKCCATNEYGKAVCTAALTVNEALTDPSDFRKLLRKSKTEENQTKQADGETDNRFWDAMLNADRKDYERICAEFGVADLDSILKKLEVKKREQGPNKCKDGVIPYDEDATEKHSLRSAGKTKGSNTKDLMQKNTGFNQVDVNDVNFLNNGLNQVDEEDNLLTEYTLSNVDFVIRIQEVKAQEREDALFVCVLTHPLPKITWMGKGNVLEDGEKYSITMSDHKLIHRLLIKDCKQLDKGIYSAVAGITSCSAWLVVDAESDPASAGKKIARKTTLAGGAQADLEKVAREQQIKNQQEMEKILASIKTKPGGGQLGDGKTNNPNELASDNEASDTEALDSEAGDSDENKNSTGQVKCSRSSKQSKMRQKAVNDPNELASDSEANHGDESKDSTGQVKHSSGSKKSKQRQKAVNDPNELASDNEANHGDENEDSTGQVKRSRGSKKSKRQQKAVHDPNELESDNEASDSDENEDSTGQVKRSRGSKKNKQRQQAVNGESTGPGDHNECDETEEATGSATHSRRKRQGPLIEDIVIDPGVQFICGLSDVNAIINESAELACKLSSEDCEGVWFRDGKKICPDDNFAITKDGAVHKLVIIRCKEEHSGKYRFEADGRKTEAMINVKDPPRFHPEALSAFTEPVAVKVGHNAIFKVHFVGHEPIKIQWYKEGEELQDDNNTRIEKSGSHSRLLLTRCQRRDTGEIKIKLKNEHGFTEALSQLIVLDKPTPPLGPAEVTESSAMCIEFRWRPPKDDGGSPVINYIMERQQVGRNTWKKLGEIPGVPTYRDTDVDHGRKYCYRIQAVTAEGTSEVMETDDMQAGTLAFPGPPAPPKVDSAYDDCINISWDSPSNRGGSRILGYILEKRKKGSNLWTVVNALDELIKEKKCAVKDVVAGMEYEFRVTAINLSGAGEFSSPSEFVFARDPKKPPGKVTSLKVTETSYTHLVLTWTKPEDKPGIQDEAKGYFVEIRQADCIEWSCCNTTPIITTSYSVKGLKSMDMYWVRVIATNDGGESAPEELANYVLAMPSPVRPKFTNHKMKSFMVVKAGNSVRITVNFEASPRPHIMWLKDNVPVARRVTVSNSDGSSQLLIPSSERSDSGIYSIVVKNLAGQETFSTEVRVTDDPKPPGLVELEENVPGTVTVIWEPSPDEKRDDRLHYTVSKLDSTKRTWITVGDRLFNNKFTVCNIMPGREYNFRVYAKNDMGVSAPSESPTWGVEKKREKFVVSVPTKKDCDLRCAPTFIVPLKLHTAPKGYECYMSCAVKGNPKPRVTWYRNHISLNTNDNYYISDTCGVCSMLILHVGPKDMGEYMITAENSLGRAECSTILSVRGGATGAWFCFQQHQTLTYLSDNLMGMQMKIVKLQSSHEEMRQSSSKQHVSESLETRLNALEESYALAQKQVGMALATAEQLRTSDLPAQVLSLHTEMKARLAEMQQATVSLEQLSQLQTMLKGKSEEFEGVRIQVDGLATLSADLSNKVEVLAGSLGEAESKLEERVGQVTALSASLDIQAAEVLRLKEQLDTYQAQLVASTLEMATVRELLESEQSQRLQQASVEEQLNTLVGETPPPAEPEKQTEEETAPAVEDEAAAATEEEALPADAEKEESVSEEEAQAVEGGEASEGEAAAQDEAPVEQEDSVTDETAPAQEVEAVKEDQTEQDESASLSEKEEVETTETAEEGQSVEEEMPEEEASEGEQVQEESPLEEEKLNVEEEVSEGDEEQQDVAAEEEAEEDEPLENDALPEDE
ncbi:immunoglobulin-like and fibronectin type III domain-containing protein 1 [Symphorus nematophorus]